MMKHQKLFIIMLLITLLFMLPTISACVKVSNGQTTDEEETEPVIAELIGKIASSPLMVLSITGGEVL